MSELNVYKKEYKGFEIFKISHFGCANYYYIAKDKERISILALRTEKACMNVIDTHLRYAKEQTQPIYR